MWFPGTSGFTDKSTWHVEPCTFCEWNAWISDIDEDTVLITSGLKFKRKLSNNGAIKNSLIV